MIATEDAYANIGIHRTQRQAERSVQGTSGKRISNGLYQKLLLTDVRQREFKRENARKMQDQDALSMQQINEYLSENCYAALNLNQRFAASSRTLN